MRQKQRMTGQEARAFVRRWRLVNAAERKELQNTSAETKLRQLSALMGLAFPMHWAPALAAEDAEVRDRWKRLRKAYGV